MLPDGRGRQALAGRRPAFWERHVDFEDSKLWAGKFVRALASAGASGLPASSGHTTAPARGIWGDAPRSLLSGSRSAREDVGTRRGGPLPLSAPGPCPPASARDPGCCTCSAPAGPCPFSPVAALVGAPPSRPAALLRKLPVRGDPILDAVTCPPTEPRTGTRLQGAGPSHGGRLAGCAREGPDPAGWSGRAGECRRRDPGSRAGAALGHARGPGGLSCG